jgi:hypothetical protein
MGVVLGWRGGCGPWLGGSGGLSMVWVSCVHFMWRCYAHEGSHIPLVWVRFFFLLFNPFGVGFVGLTSQINK